MTKAILLDLMRRERFTAGPNKSDWFNRDVVMLSELEEEKRPMVAAGYSMPPCALESLPLLIPDRAHRLCDLLPRKAPGSNVRVFRPELMIRKSPVPPTGQRSLN
jgi:hypothetical protein